MADSMASYELRGEPSGFSPLGVDRATVELLLHSDEPKDRGVNGPPQDLAPALTRLASSKLEAGHYAEAEALLVRALTITERQLGADHPDLVLLLNDLALVYLKQSKYAAAEPLLLRLLDIKRRKGENHPEVATVLGSLAVTQRALGRHESAEGLLRRVLEIREQTLAPNHFLVATALEQLAEACEARGKLGEALQLFQRAYAVREVTLGVEHPSMRACRERIADLQLQSSEGSMALVPTSPPLSTQYRYPLVGTERTEPAQSTPPPSESRALSPLTPLMRTRPFVESDPPPLRSPAGAGAEAFEHTGSSIAGEAFQDRLPYQDVLLGIEDEQEEKSDGESLRDRARAVIAPLLEFVEQRQAAAIGAVVVIALVAVALTTLRAPGDSAEAATPRFDNGLSVPVAPAARVGPAATASIADVSRGAAIDNRGAKNPSVGTKPGPTVELSRARIAQERQVTKSEAPKKADSKSISIPSVARTVMSSLDSLVSRASNAAAGAVDAPLSTPAPPVFVSQRASFDDAAGTGLPQRARLIGELPTPNIPDQLRGIQGDVRVQFKVDPVGQPVMSTFAVINSPHPLLTAAVRNVIPGMRFEPARTGGSDPMPIADVVQIWFQFARNR
jgi:hypothetical protein